MCLCFGVGRVVEYVGGFGVRVLEKIGGIVGRMEGIDVLIRGEGEEVVDIRSSFVK